MSQHSDTKRDSDPYLTLGSLLFSLPYEIDRLHDALNNRLQHNGDQVFHEIAENRLRRAERDFRLINQTIQAALALGARERKTVRFETEEQDDKCRSCCGCFGFGSAAASKNH